MYILIVCATSIEIEPLISEFEFVFQKNKNLKTYCYREFQIDVLVTGVGMVATSFLLGKTLQAYNYDIALNIGIAGCFDREIPLCSIFNVNIDCFSEMGADNGEYFLSLIDLKLIENDTFPFTNLDIINESEFKSQFISNLRKVKGITVNTINGNEKKIKRVKKLHNPTLESMEGAAFMYSCKMSNINYIQIRAVSNYVENRNKSCWNIPLAIEKLNKFILQLLNE